MPTRTCPSASAGTVSPAQRGTPAGMVGTLLQVAIVWFALIQALQLLGEEMERAVYGDGKPEPPFREYNERLRSAVADLGDGAQSCAALAPIVNRVGDSCDACHRQYR